MTARPTPITVLPKLNGPKKQHVVPRFYLDGFCRDGLLNVYDRQKNEFRIQTPHNTGAITGFYTFTDEDGRRRYDLEHLMSEYEGKAAKSSASYLPRKSSPTLNAATWPSLSPSWASGRLIKSTPLRLPTGK